MADLEKLRGAVRGLRSRAAEYPKKMPTTWFISGFTGVIVLATASIGGLETVVEPEPTKLAAGAEHVSDQLSLTLERAVLIDSFPEAGASAGDGERVLALVVEAENRWSEPLPTTGSFSVSEALRIDALGQETRPVSVARYDDATYAPWLQPGVPATLVVTWLVPVSEFADGESIAVTIRDSTLFGGAGLTTGNRWIEPVPAALTTVTVSDVGAGAEA